MRVLSYFKKIDDYRTYSKHTSKLHYDYNANSGGGQAFLGGSIVSGEGDSKSPKVLEGMTASFVVRFRDSSDNLRSIDLSDKGNASYLISPRGVGSKSMKLGIQNRTNPNLLITSLFMLPKPCGRNMATSLGVSPLTLENYWLRSMWLNSEINDDFVKLIPNDFVFEGGRSKKQGVTNKTDVVVGDQQFFMLDHECRVKDILSLAEEKSLPHYATKSLQVFRDIFLGREAFSYSICSKETTELMQRLSRDYPASYSGYSDPLVFLAELGGLASNEESYQKQVPDRVERSYNLIYFGAPGTGKSYQLSNIAKKSFPTENICRVTFHPDYTHAQFVGTFKPCAITRDLMNSNSTDGSEETISYRFVPGPFLETYVKAYQNPEQCFLLVIEEINRANPAAVFGDIFQLLDRREDGFSEYAVSTATEMREWLRVFLSEYSSKRIDFESGQAISDWTKLRDSSDRLILPSNMYIWATMNSSDQGVFPMDTAFKRRWDFRYIGINDGHKEIEGIVVPVGQPARLVSWDELRRGINKVLLEAGVNEDKLLGPFFIPPSKLTDTAHFAQIFKDKVLLYLFEDAAKTRKAKVFNHEGVMTYSTICELFDDLGELIFRGMHELKSLAANQEEIDSAEVSDDRI